MFIIDSIIKFIINFFKFFGGTVAKRGCPGLIYEPEVPKELIDLIDK